MTVPDWLPDLANVTEALGLPAFEDRLLGFLNRLLPVDHVAVFTFDPGGKAGHLFTSSRLDAAAVQTLTDAYMGGGYAEDPNLPIMQTLKPGELIDHGMEGAYAPAYREQFFGKSGLIDKASTSATAGSGTVYCNFYRLQDSGRFSPEDWEQLRALLPLVTNLIAAHRRLLPQAQSQNVQSVVHSIISRAAPPFDKLTNREREVCARVLLGYSSEAIALDLGIAASSVTTYRKRAYEKLGITGQSELFSLCLGAVERG
ncbi:helix-turn-helix transcriptional regulator [Govanella unica]|uniref:LuxR C-terminal-related transcriptional regulator n=1 Tax=Govanella unica TaxID=2975056 RepID=A0A9X3U095_9PROT|nr:LuxR C-terminal-related transcriptional regulator [Govania unica]MDA5194813.1 LuxR C-terminal-related transcriptional regulator [Govania unica]